MSNMNLLMDMLTSDLENQVIKYAVSKQIFCKQCHTILDEKKTTVVQATHKGEVFYTSCVCDACMTCKGQVTVDEMKAAITNETKRTFFQLQGIAVTVTFEHWK